MQEHTDDSVIYEFMENRRARKFRHTLWYLLMTRKLADYIIHLFLHKVHKMSRMYVMYVTGKYPVLLEELQVLEGTHTYDRFISFAEMTKQLYAIFNTSNIELG